MLGTGRPLAGTLDDLDREAFGLPEATEADPSRAWALAYLAWDAGER